MKLPTLFSVTAALLWSPFAFGQLTVIQNKEGRSKLALKMPESKIVPAASFVKMVSLATPFSKPKPVQLDLEAQFRQMKEQCEFVQAESFSLRLTGERQTTSLVGLEWKTINNHNGYQFEV